MIDPARRRQMTGMTVYVVVAFAILFVRLLPLSPGRVAMPGPDVLLCLTIAWVLRRPEQVPVLVIAAVFLIEGLLMLRPPGLWAAVVVVGPRPRGCANSVGASSRFCLNGSGSECWCWG